MGASARKFYVSRLNKVCAVLIPEGVEPKFPSLTLHDTREAAEQELSERLDTQSAPR